MSNPYYSYSGNILPGSQGRAEVVATEFQSVQAGFADLATTGTDSGTAGAYVVATPAGQPSSLTDGTTVSFRAGNTNSGSSTLAVNGGPTTLILRFDGSALQADDIVGGSWYAVTYNSNFSAWCLPSSTSTTTYAGVITGAAPAKPVALTAVGGTSTAAMPIDAQLAISTAISPTWVGNHTFNGTTTFAGPTTISGTAAISGPLSISGITTHSAGVAFTSPASFTGTATVSGVLAVSGTSTFSGPLTVSGTASTSGPLTASGTSTFSGPVTVSGPLTVPGTASFSGLFTVSGTATLGSANFSGPVVCGTAAGGAQAAGTVNATALYANGVNQTQTGTFTMTFVGGTTAPTATAHYTIINGNVVVLAIPVLTATSNSTSLSFSGLPAALQPATLTQVLSIAFGEDSGGVSNANYSVQVAPGSGSLAFYHNGGLTGFTASGTKGMPSINTVTYLLG